MKKSNRTLLISVLSAASLIAVAGALHAQTPADASPPAAVDAAVVESTRGIAGQLLNQLGAKLKAAMSTDGPMAAVSVCKPAGDTSYPDGQLWSFTKLPFLTHTDPAIIGEKVASPAQVSPGGHGWHTSMSGWRM